MDQARNDDGAYDNEGYHDDQRLPPSLGVWPLGRTYVHSSDGALNTGPAGTGAPTANAHGSPSGNGHGGPSGNAHGGPAASESTPLYDGLADAAPLPAGHTPPPAGRPPLYRIGGRHRGDDWPTDPSFRDADHIVAPPFTGAATNGSSARQYDRWADRPPAPADDPPAPSRRPPLYQVGGKYRGDDWPTDPGFRRGDLGLDADDDPVSDLGSRPDPGPRPDLDLDRSDLGRATPGPGDQRYGPGDGGPGGPGPGDGGPGPGYRDPRRGAGPGPPDTAADAERGSYGGRTGYDGEAGRGAPAGRRREPRPASAPAYDAGAAIPSRRPERAERSRPDPDPVRRIRPAAAAEGRERETWERNVTPAARVAAVEDAKLLAFLHDLIQRLKAVPSLYPRLVFLVVGYAAITSLAAAYAEAIPLPITASLIVIPAAGVIFNMGMRYPDWGRRALVGWIAGIIATIIYDGLRLSLVKVGVWGDPIPGIGHLVFADPHANFAWGYLWRFLGNGGGMGIAYTMLPWRGVRTGIAYGTLICTGLVALLFFFPVAQLHFFPLTPVTTAGAYAGHWVYGAVLGKIASWWLPPVELGRIYGRLTARLIHPGHRPRPSHARSSARASASAAGARRAAARRSA